MPLPAKSRDWLNYTAGIARSTGTATDEFILLITVRIFIGVNDEGTPRIFAVLVKDAQSPI